jgi:hypothetical protein
MFAVGRTKVVSSSVPAITTILAEPSTYAVAGESHTGQKRRCRGKPEVPPGRLNVSSVAVMVIASRGPRRR